MICIPHPAAQKAILGQATHSRVKHVTATRKGPQMGKRCHGNAVDNPAAVSCIDILHSYQLGPLVLLMLDHWLGSDDTLAVDVDMAGSRGCPGRPNQLQPPQIRHAPLLLAPAIAFTRVASVSSSWCNSVFLEHRFGPNTAMLQPQIGPAVLAFRSLVSWIN